MAASEKAYREETLKRFTQEGRDPKWARQAEKAFTADLVRLADKGHFLVVNIDCHTTTCLAKLEWPTYAEARHAEQLLAEKTYSHNCGKDVFTPAPDDPSGSYQGTMVLNCEAERIANP
jgi:hypothetical protein